MPRFYCPAPLRTGQSIDLPAGAARHVQVLRMQPGESVTLFNSGIQGDGALQFVDAGEYQASIIQMGRNSVTVMVGEHSQPVREYATAVHLVLGVPANDRMDWLVEKATELGVASISPLVTERSVLRLAGERAEKKVHHWQSVAIAACEQCGGNRVPMVHGMTAFRTYLQNQVGTQSTKALLSLRSGAQYLQQWKKNAAEHHSGADIVFLSGPEGGLSVDEEDAAIAAGFTPLSLGQRTLRAETAALAALSGLVL